MNLEKKTHVTLFSFSILAVFMFYAMLNSESPRSASFQSNTLHLSRKISARIIRSAAREDKIVRGTSKSLIGDHVSRSNQTQDIKSIDCVFPTSTDETILGFDSTFDSQMGPSDNLTDSLNCIAQRGFSASIIESKVSNDQHQRSKAIIIIHSPKDKYFAFGMLKHINKLFDNPIDVYLFPFSWDYRCPLSSFGEKFQGYAASDVQYVYLNLNVPNIWKSLMTDVKDGFWGIKTVKDDLPSISNKIIDGVFYHPEHKFAPLTRPSPTRDGSIQTRPLVITNTGEVFWERFYNKRDSLDSLVDAFTYRAYGNHIKGENAQRIPHIHYFNGVYHQAESIIKEGSDWGDIVNPVSIEDAKSKLQAPKFASFISSSSSCWDNIKKFRFPDAYIRPALVKKVMDYKNVSSYGQCLHTETSDCTKLNFLKAGVDCMSDSKFVLTIDNQYEDGYVTEKIFNGLAARSVPVYFGGPVVNSLINPKRFVFCNVSLAKIDKLRETFNNHGMDHLMVTGGAPLAAVMEHANGFVGEDLDKCVAEIVELDNNPDKYIEKLTAKPVFLRSGTENNEFDGFNTSLAISSLLKTMGSTLVLPLSKDGKIAPPKCKF